MPRVFVPSERLIGEQVLLDGEPHRHLAKVLRLQPGDGVLVFDGGGTEIEARVLAVGPKTIELSLGPRRAGPLAPENAPLLRAVPRGERMALIVQKATELGGPAIVPVLPPRWVAKPGAPRSRRWQT